ncbi:MAG: DUF1800 domain-containing protein, partial [Acetobacteraceae bacterium]|nr:DUF1800 domain-containing protein [Acetobacteraceae bacterium]
MDARAAHSLIRFGLGRKGTEPVPADPQSWLAEQLLQPDPTRFDPAPSTARGLTALRDDRRNKPPPGQSRSRETFRADAAAELRNALTTAVPFRERLVWFWTNHFAVSLRRPASAPLIGAFIEEAIRPHITARFGQMLLAVIRHPAMLLYLDNARSVGPDSPAGLRTGRGLNENLARECLELHTVTQAGGYTQADVTSFARVLTGWSIDLKDDPPGFRFRPGAHEPGEQTVLGRTYPAGEQGGVEALAFLAAHPATHRGLAVKLARHFIADDPPPIAVHRIEAALRDTSGDLGAAALAITRLDDAWKPLAKFRTPTDFVIASLRAFNLPEERWPNLPGVRGGLGQPLWAAPLPNGWSDRAA